MMMIKRRGRRPMGSGIEISFRIAAQEFSSREEVVEFISRLEHELERLWPAPHGVSERPRLEPDQTLSFSQ